LPQLDDIRAGPVRLAPGRERSFRLMDLDHTESKDVEHPGGVDGILLIGRNDKCVWILSLYRLVSYEVEISQQTLPVARRHGQTGSKGNELVGHDIVEMPFAAGPRFRKIPAGPLGVVPGAGIQLFKSHPER